MKKCGKKRKPSWLRHASSREIQNLPHGAELIARPQHENTMSISRKRLAEIASIKDADIDTSDIPELDEGFWEKAKVIMPQKHDKTQITADFDTDLIEWFKQQGRGYQSRMNAVLRSYYEANK